MNIDEARTLLGVITALDRKPFPANAAEAWAPLLASITYGDAEHAVQEHYRTDGAAPIRPSDIRARAARLVELRERNQRRALPPAPVHTTAVAEQRKQEIRALIARAVARFDIDRTGREPASDEEETWTRTAA